MAIVTNGLVGYWNYKQGVDITNKKWTNLAPNYQGKNDGVISSQGVSLVADSVQFDGLQGQVDLGNDPSVNISGSVTLEALVIPTNLANEQQIIGKYDYSTYRIEFNNNVIRGTANSADVDNTVSSSNNQLYHIAFTVDQTANTENLYVNGVLVRTQPWNQGPINVISYNLNIGYNSDGGAYFTGKVKCIRLYNTALSATDISNNYNNGESIGLPSPQIVTNGLVGYWNSKQGVSGATWNNIAPATLGSYNGTLKNGISLQSNGMTYDGVDDCVMIPLPPDFLFGKSTSFTVEIRVSLNNISSNPDIIKTGTSTTYSSNTGVYSLYPLGTQWAVDMSDDSSVGHEVLFNSTINSGVDYYLSYSYDTSTKSITFYQNGINLGTQIFDNTSKTYYFSKSGNTSFWLTDPQFPANGIIDNIRFYNRILSSTEIAQNYEVGSSVGLNTAVGTVYTKPLSDSIYLTDSNIKRSSTKRLSDTILLSDKAITKKGVKKLSETLLISDKTITKKGFKTLTDTLSITDSVPIIEIGHPPSVTIISIDHNVISDEQGINSSTIKFKFDIDITAWTVNVMGASWDTGTVADNGGIVSAGTEITAIVDWTELYQEGQNRVNIYGQNAGNWTPYNDSRSPNSVDGGSFTDVTVESTTDAGSFTDTTQSSTIDGGIF